IRASGRAFYRTYSPHQGWVEQKPMEWWRAMCELTPQILAQSGAQPSAVVAIGITAQMCGVVPLDKNGEVLADCPTCVDTRSAAIAKRLVGARLRAGGYNLRKAYPWLRLTGGAPNLSGKDPVTKMIWFKEQRPDIFARVHKFLDVKDFIVHRLT